MGISPHSPHCHFFLPSHPTGLPIASPSFPFFLSPQHLPVVDNISVHRFALIPFYSLPLPYFMNVPMALHSFSCPIQSDDHYLQRHRWPGTRLQQKTLFHSEPVSPLKIYKGGPCLGEAWHQAPGRWSPSSMEESQLWNSLGRKTCRASPSHALKRHLRPRPPPPPKVYWWGFNLSH